MQGEYGEAQLDLVLWVTGINNHAEDKPGGEDITLIDEEYKLLKTMKNVSDVGYLSVQVVQAKGLGSPKLQGNPVSYTHLTLPTILLV